jgi:hypothetical protein
MRPKFGNRRTSTCSGLAPLEAGNLSRRWRMTSRDPVHFLVRHRTCRTIWRITPGCPESIEQRSKTSLLPTILLDVTSVGSLRKHFKVSIKQTLGPAHRTGSMCERQTPHVGPEAVAD